ncbi:hypothetical protein GQS40_00345|uniref:Tyrosine-type recombinase/integrase n=1 Tax=Leuconostoc lactis TaxID=1246 RepID=A0A6L7A4T1_LEULA|nr:hypothetical protein [Leuconostoc lactis]
MARVGDLLGINYLGSHTINVLKMVQDTLLDSFRAGRRNYTIFQVGKATLLRVSDVMTLKKSDVYNPDGSVKHTAFIHDKKTGKAKNAQHPH